MGPVNHTRALSGLGPGTNHVASEYTMTTPTAMMASAGGGWEGGAAARRGVSAAGARSQHDNTRSAQLKLSAMLMGNVLGSTKKTQMMTTQQVATHATGMDIIPR